MGSPDITKLEDDLTWQHWQDVLNDDDWPDEAPPPDWTHHGYGGVLIDPDGSYEEGHLVDCSRWTDVRAALRAHIWELAAWVQKAKPTQEQCRRRRLITVADSVQVGPLAQFIQYTAKGKAVARVLEEQP